MFEMSVKDTVINVAPVIFMGICALFDIKRKEIPVYAAAVGIFTAAALDFLHIFQGSLSFVDMGMALLPGGFFFLISFVTKEKVGYGDGLLLLMSGLFVGLYRCCFCLCISLLSASVFAIILIGMGKAEKNSKIPFAPFLAIGLGVGMFV